jgi:hypothetical protein
MGRDLLLGEFRRSLSLGGCVARALRDPGTCRADAVGAEA